MYQMKKEEIIALFEEYEQAACEVDQVEWLYKATISFS